MEICHVKMFLVHLLVYHLVAGQKEGDLRLSGESSHTEGRLEIYYNGTWGTVCDDYFSTPDATVACRQIFNGKVRSAYFYTAGGGTGRTWMDNVNCDGDELNLSDCTHRGWGVENCGHSEDVGIQCFLAEEGDLRLSDSSSPTEGRLEIYYNGTWGTVCDDDFTTPDATVACRQLLNREVRNVSFYTAGSGSGHIWLDDVSCYGTEWSLSSCAREKWGDNNCDHDEDVGIRCYDTEGDLRLSDGSSHTEGRLEVYYNGTWGTVCDDDFSTSDATVACRQLLNREVRTAYFYTAGGGTGRTWMDDVNCNGDELNLSDCTHNGWGVENCGHSEDVGIQCILPKEGDLHVSAGMLSGEGRLEIYHNGRWGTICNKNFDTLDTLVACRQLANGNVRNVSFYTAGGGTGTIWMDNLSCSGSESNLINCPHSRWGSNTCTHDEDVGIRCRDDGELRLSDGNTSTEGRLEIIHNGRWGTICEDSFDIFDALVACRQLTNREWMKVSYYTVGGGTGPVWMRNLACKGVEWELQNCSNSKMIAYGCSHDKDVGVRCYAVNEDQNKANCSTQSPTQWSTIMVGGIAAGGVVGTIVLELIGYCIYRATKHRKHGIGNQNLRRCPQHDDRQTYELTTNSVEDEIYDQVQ